MARALIVEIFGNATQFAAELDKAAGKTRQLSAAAGVAGIALAGGLAFGLEKSIKAAMAGQASQASLDAALRNTHQSLDAMAPALDKAEASSRRLGFADDETRTALARLEIASGSTKAAITDLGVAEDLSRAKHIDLANATTALASAMAGSQRAAKQLGIIVPAVTTHLDRLKASNVDLSTASGKALEAHAKLLDKMATGQAVIDATSAKVHGQAQAFAGTAAGGMAQFHAQLQHLEESLGGGLLPALNAVTSKLADFASFLSQHKVIAESLVIALGALATTLIAVSVASGIASAAAGVAAAATAAWTAAQWLLNAALTANPIGVVVVALAALGAALAIAWTKSETFRNIVKTALSDVEAVGHKIASFFTDTLPAAFESVLNWVKGHWPEIAVLIAGPFAPLVALATNAFGIRSALTGAFEDVLAFMRSLPGRILAALGDLSHLLVNAGVSIIQGLIDGLKSKLSEVEDLASKIGGKIASLKGPISADLKLLVPHGEAIITGLQTGMENRLGGVYATASQIAPAIAGATPTGAGGGGVGGELHIHVGTVIGTSLEDAAKELYSSLQTLAARDVRRGNIGLPGVA